MPDASGNLVLEDAPCWKHFLQTNLSDSGSQESDSIPTGRKLTSLSKQWSDVTRVITGSSHPRHGTEWLAEIDQATSLQELDDVGAVFGDCQMSLETLDSQNAQGLVKNMNPEFKRQIQVLEDSQD